MIKIETHLLVCDSRIGKDVNRVKDGSIEDFDCTILATEGSKVIFRDVKTFKQGICGGEAVRKINTI